MSQSENDIAIVGMAIHVPGARGLDEYWQLLSSGTEAIRELSDDDLTAAGVGPDTARRPGYVRAAAPLDDVYEFDAEFFGFSPKEAAILDPQHRHFLMTAWEAFEDAGHPPESIDGSVGVFAGCGMNGYFMFNLLSNRDLVREVGMFLLRHTGNDKDFLSTRVSYLFDLHGPSVNVQTACSTSLVATHLAVQHLLSGECDVALAGGVTIEMPHGRGYQYEPGEILSPDGHCRPFDHRAEGTVFGSGAGAVVLRRLDDALADGDHIYAVIKSTAVNNDGGRKVGYLAPSVDGQAACIAEALAVADIDPATIGFVECHGTGTPMGDPIEVAALTQAFKTAVGADQPCWLGSVKSNIGHLDTAAGVAGLVKAVLALGHGQVPPTVHFEQPNPALDLDAGPFGVNAELVPWSRPDGPRRAAINSLGVGGTNAFAVIEQAPDRAARPSGQAGRDSWRVLTVTGRGQAALDQNAAQLAQYLRAHPDVDLGDVAATLHTGRKHFAQRRVVAARTAIEAADLLEITDPRGRHEQTAGGSDRPVTFLFPGGGSHYPAMGAGLRASEPVFAEHVDAGLRLAHDQHGLDLERFLTSAEPLADADLMVHQLPLIFIAEYAMAQLLRSWGITPAGLLGHSLGENTAACVAGTFSFADMLGLVVLRGQLMDEIDGGAVSVPLAADELRPLLDELGLDLAVENQPDLCLASGAVDALAVLTQRLAEHGIETMPVGVTTPVHSRLLEPALDRFELYLRSITLRPPSISWVSNRTGTWITPELATDPAYWVEHLHRTVRFSECVETVTADTSHVLVEVGPGRTLTSLVGSHPARKASQPVVATMRHTDDGADDAGFAHTALGRLAAAGVPVDAELLTGPGPHRRVPLPPYAFQQQRYLIEAGSPATADPEAALFPGRAEEQRWWWRPTWLHRDRDLAGTDPLSWLVIVDEEGLGDDVAARLRGQGHDVVTVCCGDSFQVLADDRYVIAPELGSITYESLVRELIRVGRLPDRIAHLALLSSDDQRFRPGSSFFHRNLELGFQSVVQLAQAWSAAGLQRPVHLSVATMGAHVATPRDQAPWPEQAAVLGPVRVIPRELEGVTASSFDLAPPAGRSDANWGRRLGEVARRAIGSDGVDDPREQLVDTIIDELSSPPANEVVAVRDSMRFVLDVRQHTLAATATPRLQRGAVTLITGGLGGIGLTIASALHDAVGARLALMSRRGLPPRHTWPELVDRLGPDHPTVVQIRGVEALEARGAEVLVVSGDVVDVEATTAAIAEVRARFGRLDAVIHAAGVIDDALLATKSVVDMDDVLAPKVYGTLVLEDATRTDDLSLFAVFSSTSAPTAPVGQTDYVAANEFVNAFAASRRAADHDDVVAIGWGVWNEVGMTAALSSALAPGERAELRTDAATGPWFEQRIIDRYGTVRLTTQWTADDWVLDDHRTGDGDPLVPGSAYLELARAALAEVGIRQPFEISELTFLRPLAPGADGVVRFETLLEPTAEGYSLVVREQVCVARVTAEGVAGDEQTGFRRCAEATLRLGAFGPAAAIDLDAVRASCPDAGPRRTAQQNHLRFGPRWDVVDDVHESPRRAIADLRLPDPFAGDLESIGLHPALIDLGTGFAMSLVDGYLGDRLWVPVSYRTARVHGRLKQQVVAVATARPGSSQERGFATFDVALCNTDGSVVVEVLGFTIKRLDGSLDVSPGRAIAVGELEREQAAADRPLSTAEAALSHNVGLGVTPEEGGALFTELLSADAPPVVYASPIPLPALRRQSDAIAAAQLDSSAGSGAVFDRPALDSEYVAPRNDVEEELVAIWQELLGVNNVGVDDDFFALGGHSLIAVRLFTRVRRRFSVDFPISVLFDAPTVAQCADLIADALPADTEAASDQAEDAGPVSTAAVPRPRFRHLVPMHPGDGGPHAPFFLVAGMFGNVLNLRQLAHQISADRPFYGLQARGLFGGNAPHEDFAEMAADYVEEVRVVQPHGPYLLGGFSGGGITALEMARKLIQSGEEVGLLVMLDTPTPTNPELSLIEKVRLHGAQIRQDGAGYVGDWARSRIAWERAKRNPPEEADSGSLNSASIGHAFYRAIDRYEMRHYPGTITLYRPRLSPLLVFGPDRQIDRGRRFIYHDNGWGPWCNRVDVTEVPGSHDGMVLEPNVRVLASHIRSRIDEVERQRATLSWAAEGNDT